MALRAGYYGVKRRIWEALQTITSKNVQDIADIWNNNNNTGVHNALMIATTSTTVHGVTFTVSSEGIDAHGTADAEISLDVWRTPISAIPFKKMILNGCPAGGSSTTYRMILRELNADDTDGPAHIDTGAGTSAFQFAENTAKLRVYINIKSGTQLNHKLFKPMVRDANDPDPTYAEFAMTNQQLTASANDQKTAINAIISAATGAADFAAFKIAMAALTPLTRSTAPDERSLDVEVEEPAVVKKTTRKKTTKTEEEE